MENALIRLRAWQGEFFCTFGLLLAIAYVPGWTGAASSPRWGVLVVGAALGMLFVDTFKPLTLPHAIGVAFLLYAIWMVGTAPEAGDQHWKIVLLALLFLVGTGMWSWSFRSLLLGASWGIGLSSALVIADLAGLISYPQVSRPSGLFVNGLYLAEFAAMVLAGCVALRMWWSVALCVPSILLVSLPRGPLVGLAVAAICSVWSRNRVSGLMMLLCLAFMVPALIEWRPATVEDRLSTWLDIFRSLNWLGHGLGSYFGDAPMLGESYSGNRPLHANNDLFELAYDLGAPGVILALVFVQSLFLGRCYLFLDERAAHMVVIVFVVEGLFGFPFFLPWSVGLFALSAGYLAGCSGNRLIPIAPG